MCNWVIIDVFEFGLMVKFFVVLVVFVNGIVDKNIIIDIGDGIM